MSFLKRRNAGFTTTSFNDKFKKITYYLSHLIATLFSR